jgi:hypothetical protein
MTSASSKFNCPHCLVSLTKSAAAEVLGSMGASMGSGAYLGSLASSVTCPACGGAIDTQKMIAGHFDHEQGSALGCVFAAVFIIGGTYWINAATGYNVFASAGLAFGLFAALGLGVALLLTFWRRVR